MAYLHGIEVIRIDDGVRPIETLTSSVIGLVGTAPTLTLSDDVSEEDFAYNKPFLITNRKEAANLGTEGTLPNALDAVFDQAGATIVVVRVEQGADDDATLSNLIGGFDVATDQRTGVEALLDAKSSLGVTPRILSIPEFSHQQALVTATITIAESLKAVIIADCDPAGTYSDAITYRGLFGSERLYLHYPSHDYWNVTTDAKATRSAAPAIAGLLAKVDSQFGFWASPSNHKFNGILGSSKPIDFEMGDANSRANLLNENEVATTINNQGIRLWGNSTTSSDVKYKQINVIRTADMIDDSIKAAFNDFVDKGITKNFINGIVESVSSYLNTLQARGAILGGSAWADPTLNTKNTIALGQLFIDYDFTPIYAAERITFRSQLVNDYITNLFN